MNLAFMCGPRAIRRASLDAAGAGAAIDPNVTVFDAAPLKEFIGASLYPQKVAASLMAVMGGMAVLLAAVGLYSVMAYWVAQRTQEIGVRMALGAPPGYVLRMVVRKGLAVTAAGHGGRSGPCVCSGPRDREHVVHQLGDGGTRQASRRRLQLRADLHWRHDVSLRHRPGGLLDSRPARGASESDRGVTGRIGDRTCENCERCGCV